LPARSLVRVKSASGDLQGQAGSRAEDCMITGHCMITEVCMITEDCMITGGVGIGSGQGH
jgi:hypothetical protein